MLIVFLYSYLLYTLCIMVEGAELPSLKPPPTSHPTPEPEILINASATGTQVNT